MKDVESQNLLEGPSARAEGDEQRFGDSEARARLWTQVAASVAREKGARAWFRSRPTSERRIWALAAAFPAVVIGSSRRNEAWLADAGAAPWVWFGAFNLLVVLCIVPLLRPLGRAPSSGLNSVALALAAALPAIHVLLEGVGHQPAARDALAHGVSCFLFGSVLSLPFVAVVLTLDRSDRPSVFSRALTGAAGGLLASGALVLHCADRTWSHLVASHASVGWALALVGMLAAWRMHRVAVRADP